MDFRENCYLTIPSFHKEQACDSPLPCYLIIEKNSNIFNRNQGVPLKFPIKKTGHHLSVNPVFISDYYEIKSFIIQFASLPVLLLPSL
ncbi:hypothetical protein C806_04343 [Lachnospiraceae bacterium 3-1]|nr:hypothetical protein C806_04343 [Lachnospiraceae bacterium 3-1]